MIMQYPINEMFQTLQGEGYFTSVPAIFIRLQGMPGWLRLAVRYQTYRDKRGSEVCRCLVFWRNQRE